MKLFLLIFFCGILAYSGGVFFENDVLASTSNKVSILEREDGWGVTAIDPKTSKVYITNFKSDTVTVIDGDTNQQVSEIKVGSSPYGIGINTETKMLFVALERANMLVIVDTKSGDIVAEIELADPYDIAVNSKTNKAYVTSDKTNTVYVIDGNQNKIVTSFSVDDPCGVAVNEETNMVYVTSESTDTVHVIDGTDDSFVTTIDVGKSPRGVVANPLTNQVYITNQLDGTVDVIDGSTNEVVDSISVGNTPRRIVVNPETNILYVSNQISNSLSVIDGETNEVIDTIPVEQPFELMINTKTNKVYSTYYGNPTLSIVHDVILSEDASEKYETIIGVLGAGVIAAIIAFFVVRKKKLKNNLES